MEMILHFEKDTTGFRVFLAIIPADCVLYNKCGQTSIQPVGLGLQIFGLITLSLVINNYALLGKLKSLRAQSVGEVSAY